MICSVFSSAIAVERTRREVSAMEGPIRHAFDGRRTPRRPTRDACACARVPGRVATIGPARLGRAREHRANLSSHAFGGIR